MFSPFVQARWLFCLSLKARVLGSMSDRNKTWQLNSLEFIKISRIISWMIFKLCHMARTIEKYTTDINTYMLFNIKYV